MIRQNNNNNKTKMCKTNGQQDSNEVGLAQMNDFQKQLLEEHNKRRQQHGIPPLQWDHDIARQTQQWANKMAKEGKLKHSQADQRHSLGENIANNSKSDYTGNEATEQWYSEIQYFDWNNCSTFNPKTGHFTQVMWKGSRKIGAAISTTPAGVHFVCARYEPAGNMRGSFEENLLPTSSSETPQVESSQPCSDHHAEGREQNKANVEVDDEGKASQKFQFGTVQHRYTMKPTDKENQQPILAHYSYQKALSNPHSSKENERLPCQTVKVDTKSKQPKQQAAYLVNKDNYLQYGKSYSVTHYVY